MRRFAHGREHGCLGGLAKRFDAPTLPNYSQVARPGARTVIRLQGARCDRSATP
jgi:hypothetical protein